MSDAGIDRRDFGRVTLGALGAAALAGQSRHAAAQKTGSTIKLCVQSPATPSDEQLLFLKNLGAEYVSVASTPKLRTADGFQQIKRRYADNGITVWNIGNTSVHNMSEVTLNPVSNIRILFPGRPGPRADAWPGGCNSYQSGQLRWSWPVGASKW